MSMLLEDGMANRTSQVRSELSRGVMAELSPHEPSSAPPATGRAWFLLGLFLTTLATLALETLDTRFVSAMTWYHLSFFAVSIAMFGMAAGAVRVYLDGDVFVGEKARAQLERWAGILALAIPVSHVVNLCIPFTVDFSLTAVAGSVLGTLVLAAPFYAAGVVVAIALTRIPGRAGFTYAVDLAGAALGSLLVLPLLTYTNLSSAVFVVGGLAAVGCYAFARMNGTKRTWAPALALGLVVLGLANDLTAHGFRAMYAKEKVYTTGEIAEEAWNIHSHVIARTPALWPAQYWGKGTGAPETPLNMVIMNIDGEAGTKLTEWNGEDIGALDWVRYDVTSLPYHLRKGGDAAIIGVGGGRDLLTALWGRSKSVTGIEINEIFVRFLTGRWRDFAGLADRPDVTIVHDEARSYLTRVDKRFDVLQMSLIDTWAATGAGAFTLSENGLYTLDAWHVFLHALTPTGVFSVSRWFSPDKASETCRLLSLGTAALLDLGVEAPEAHLLLVARDQVATLMVSPSPFTEADLREVRASADQYGFRVLLAPDQTSELELLDRIAHSRSREALLATVLPEPLDFTPPTDERPFFFNTLRPTKIVAGIRSSTGVLVRGNLLATATLLLLFLISAGLVSGVILGPLYRSGLPRMDRRGFGHAVAYFTSIGMGFMLVQIPFMQRFSVYLGHPTYAIAVILFSMILFTGIGSFVSDYVPVERKPVLLVVLPLVIAAVVAGCTLALQPVIDGTIRYEIAIRALVVVGFAAPVAFLLGFCFPIGLRLTGRISSDATPWMWGVNGAAGVLASVIAVAVSMWAGIHVSLLLSAALYAGLVFHAPALWRLGERIDAQADRRSAGTVG
jgi:hypothetical protein